MSTYEIALNNIFVRKFITLPHLAVLTQEERVSLDMAVRRKNKFLVPDKIYYKDKVLEEGIYHVLRFGKPGELDFGSFGLELQDYPTVD